MKSRFVILIACALGADAQVFQNTNPFYPKRNPFYFEGKVDYDKLNITTPKDAWEYLQRGIYLQDQVGDKEGAIADYRQSVALNGIGNGTCQIVRTATPAHDPAPCMFTNRLRLGYLLLHDSPDEAVSLFREVLEIDPLRLEVNELIGEAYEAMAHQTGDESLMDKAIDAYQAEIALSPITSETISLTGDAANSAHVHWSLARIYQQRGEAQNQATELDLYLKATRRHSDVYPWRVAVARQKLAGLRATGSQ